ncbi:MAG: hypothetical protein WED07_13525 [Candidatus Freyarchaeum deiterrae]
MPKNVKEVEINTEDMGLIWSCFVNWVNTLEKTRISSHKPANREK